MKWQIPALEYIAHKNLYFSRPPIPSLNFETFCRDRETFLSSGQLERLDRTGFFKPLGRYRCQKTVIKIEQTADGIKELGKLEDSEHWAGMTHERVSAFSPRFLREYFDRGQILDSEQMPTAAWNSSEFINLYSEFQFYPLWKCLNESRIYTPTIDEIVTRSDQDLADSIAATCRFLRDQTPAFVESLQASQNVALVCQAISNRYYPPTQTDQRTIQISSVVFDWDWHEYRRTWDAKQIAKEMGLAQDEIFNMWRHVKSEASRVDPLREWNDLLKFVAVSEKLRLRGKALLAYSLENMAAMLASFYEDVFGKPITTSFPIRRAVLLPKEEPHGTLRELEYVTNKYQLNPRPKLILLVEGESETDQIPRLMEHFWGHSLATAEIEILNLKGVANFTGNSKRDRFGALKRLIDDYHHRQTIVYILLDNEGRATAVKSRLIQACSAYSIKRSVTNAEYVHVWERNYEFDNFSDAEIAGCMSVLSPNTQFTEEEVKTARQNFKPQDSDTLGRLYSSRTRAALEKRALGHALTNCIISEAAPLERPIISQLGRIIELAAWNHQPTSGKAWEVNQQSGYFGEKLP